MSELFSRRGFLAATAAGALGVALAGCAAGKPEPTPSDDDATDIGATVMIGDNFYEPAEVRIAPGQSVRWEWVGREQHDVVADDASFVTELVREGSFTHTFTEAGEFGYLCSIHPEMRGIVIVEG